MMVWRDFMRIRVHLEVLQPMKRHKVVKKPDSGCFKVSFKYERLATFCFFLWNFGAF